jgi:hypothetical protein
LLPYLCAEIQHGVTGKSALGAAHHEMKTDGVTYQLGVQPSLDTVREVLAAAGKAPNLVPILLSISAEFLTPSSIYLKLSAK